MRLTYDEWMAQGKSVAATQRYLEETTEQIRDRILKSVADHPGWREYVARIGTLLEAAELQRDGLLRRMAESPEVGDALTYRKIEVREVLVRIKMIREIMHMVSLVMEPSETGHARSYFEQSVDNSAKTQGISSHL